LFNFQLEFVDERRNVGRMPMWLWLVYGRKQLSLKNHLHT
jgi:hypothetical protein